MKINEQKMVISIFMTRRNNERIEWENVWPTKKWALIGLRFRYIDANYFRTTVRVKLIN